MADDSKGLKWYIRAIFDRESGVKVGRELEDLLAESGKKGGTGFLKELRAAFDKRMADLRVSLAKGLINQAEFGKQANLAAQHFNTVMIAGLEKARAAGNLTEREFVKLSRQLKKTGDEGATAFDRIRGKLLSVGAAIGSFFALSRITQWGREAVAAATQARQALAQLEAAQQSTGNASGFTTAQLIKQAEALERLSLFSKEAVQGGLTRLLTYTAIQGEMFERASVAALDMAQRLGIDVASAAEKVGNALNYPTKALNSLTRQGFRFTEQQTQQIKEMERTGNIAGAQAIILKELELAYGGAALAASNAVGPWRQFGLEVGRLKQALGETILQMAEQSGVAGRLTSVVKILADNIGGLVGVVLSLGKALVVAGVLSGMARLVTVVKAADLAFKGWRATLVSMQALIGPKGWITLGVLGLTVAFEKMGAGARKAAQDAKAAVDEFAGAIQSASDAELAAKAAVLAAQRGALEQQLAALKSSRSLGRQLLDGFTGRWRAHAGAIRDTELQLNTVLEQGNLLLAERKQRAGGGGAPPASPPPATGGGQQAEEVLAEADAVDRLAEAEQNRREADQALSDDAFASSERERMELEAIEAAYAQAEATRQAVAVGALQVTTEADAALHAYNREQYIANELLRHGAELGTGFGEALAHAAGQSYDAAHRFVSPWQDALGNLKTQAEESIGIVGDLAAAWATGGVAEVARLAKAKVKEHLAAAIGEAAKALGALAIGNIGAANKHGASAIKHGIAAAKWGVAAASAGSGGGSAAAGGGGSSVANPNAGSNTQAPGPEVHIYIDPLEPTSAKAQVFVQGAVHLAQQRQGDNAVIRIHRRTG